MLDIRLRSHIVSLDLTEEQLDENIRLDMWYIHKHSYDSKQTDAHTTHYVFVIFEAVVVPGLLHYFT